MRSLLNMKFSALAKLLAIAFLFASPAARADQKNLRIGISQYPSTLNPYFDDMVAKSYVLGTALRPVTVHGADWMPACALCTELPTYANGRAKKEKGGIAATYTLKPDLFWGDGAPVTSADIVFAWQVGKHPQSGVGNAEFFATDIRGIDAADARTFTIHFSKEKCDFASIDDFYPLPAHLEKKVFEQAPATYINRTLYNTDPANPGLWLGPYKVARAESGAAVTVDRNPYWKGSHPAFDSITFRAIENSPALTANLLSGDIDYIAGEIGLLLDQAVAFERRLPPGKYDVTYKPGLTYEHIDLPLDKPPFGDVRVRRALMLGMNRAALNGEMFSGRQQEAVSDVNPLDSVFTDDVRKYPYDPAAAEALLDAAGLPRDASGRRFPMTLSTTAGNRTRETVAVAIQSDWKKIGIDVTLKNSPARVLFGQTMRERRFEGGVMYAWMSSPANIPKTTLHSSMIPSSKNSYAGQNYAGYSNQKMDKIIDDLDVVCGAAENKALWADLQKLYADDLPALPLYYRSDAFIVPRWLKGIVPTGHMHPTTLHVEDWSVSE
jgi:peptide/nickel transport system substrate-binding protein